MKAQATKSRSKAARRPAQTAPLTQLFILDALRTWVIPTIAGVIGFAIFILYNLELIDQPVGVAIVGGLALLVALFYGVCGFIGESMSATLGAVLGAFVLLWGATTFYPFYRAVDPGTPLVTRELHRDGPPATLPLSGKPGRYSMIVEDHFLPTAEHSNRTAKYSIAIGHDGVTDRVLDGTFSQEWGSQRIGAGRRSSLVPVMRQTLQQLDTIDDADGRDVTLKLTELSPGVADTVTVRLYGETVPKAALIAFAVLTLAAAVVIDAWRPKGKNQGLLTTLTVAIFVTIVVFRESAVAAPGFPQLIIATLVGTLVGGLAASLLWRLIQPVRKYLPTQP